MVTRKRAQIFWLWLLGLCLLQSSLVYATLTASVDRTVLSESDIITLTIRSTKGAIEDGADFASMLPNFTILNSQRSNQFSFINGKRSSNYDLVLTLAPNGNGTLTIPAFSGNGEATTPISISVTAGSKDSQQDAGDVFIESSVNKESVYVQAQLILTVKIYYAVGLSEAHITEPEIAGALVQKLGEGQKQEALLKGVRYSIIEQNYAIFPETSGQLEIPELLLSGRTQSRFGNRFRSNGQFVRVKSRPISIRVLPKPDAFPVDEPWLPATALVVDDSWEMLDPETRAGEPVTRTITVTAKGVAAAQLPPVELPQVSGLKMYPDQPQRDEKATAQGLVAQQTSATAIVPVREGDYSIAPIRIYWWDTDTNTLMNGLIKGRTIHASAVPLISQPAVSASEEKSAKINAITQDGTTRPDRWLWPTLAALFAFLWLITAYLWWAAKSRKKAAMVAPESIRSQKLESRRQAYRLLRKACNATDPAAAREALLAWLKVVFSDESIRTLNDVVHLDCHLQLAPMLVELDAVLYGQPSTENNRWDGKSLLKVIEQIKKTEERRCRRRNSRSLPSLYPLS